MLHLSIISVFPQPVNLKMVQSHLSGSILVKETSQYSQYLVLAAHLTGAGWCYSFKWDGTAVQQYLTISSFSCNWHTDMWMELWPSKGLYIYNKVGNPLVANRFVLNPFWGSLAYFLNNLFPPSHSHWLDLNLIFNILYNCTVIPTWPSETLYQTKPNQMNKWIQTTLPSMDVTSHNWLLTDRQSDWQTARIARVAICN